MRDEFNNSSNYDEFSGCDVKEDHFPMEYDMPSENGRSIEFRMPVEYFENNSYGDDSGKDSHNNKLKKRHKIKMNGVSCSFLRSGSDSIAGKSA